MDFLLKLLGFVLTLALFILLSYRFLMDLKFSRVGENAPLYAEAGKFPLSTLSSSKSRNSVQYSFDCRNINQIEILGKLGHGHVKQAFKGNYMGLLIAVKTEYTIGEKIANKEAAKEKFQVHLTSLCQQQMDKGEVDNTMGLGIKRKAIMDEILMHQQLDHAGIVNLLGYCLDSDISSGNLSYQGPVSVFELGNPFHRNGDDKQFQISWQQRLHYAIQLADLLDYLENSPLGPLPLSDSKPSNFVIVNNDIKLVDLYLWSPTRKMCQVVSCKKDRSISSITAEFNLFNMNQKFLRFLLSSVTFPENVAPAVERIIHALNNTELSALSLKGNLSSLL